MAAGIYHWSFLFFRPSFDTCLLIKSMACALSCSALCKSARMRVSATFSTERLLHRASSHMTFKRLRAYWGGREGGGEDKTAAVTPGRRTAPRAARRRQLIRLNLLAWLLLKCSIHSFSRLFLCWQWANFWGTCSFCFTQNGGNYQNNYSLWNSIDYKGEKTCLCRGQYYAIKRSIENRMKTDKMKTEKINIPTEKTKTRFSGIISSCDNWHLNNHY